MRIGRLTAAGALVLALAALVAVPSLARVQRHPAVVVKGRGFKLTAWDARDKDRSLCFRLTAGAQKASQCEKVVQRKARLNFASFQNARRTVTFLGGVARRNVTKVVATFRNGGKVTYRTVRGKRYRGRRRGKVRFWAGRHGGASLLKSLVAKTSGGSKVETISVPPTPAPPPCGCGGPPISRGACPAVAQPPCE